MDDKIPTGYIGLPEALDRLEGFVSDAHLQRARSDLDDGLSELERLSDVVKASDVAAAQFTGMLRYLSKFDFAVEKLRIALQTGALGAKVRDPNTGQWCRLTQADWLFEPFWEQILRGGVVPASASKGFQPHRGRTVLIEITDYEAWLATELKAWPQSSKEKLCRNWLLREMKASPADKRKPKAAWFAVAKAKFKVSWHQFERAWSTAVKESNSNWGQPGAPKKPRKESPR
jgi:hypothetical protein